MSGPVLATILVSQAIGGLASILTKLALGGLEPWTLVFLRQLLGGAILFVMWRATRKPGPALPFTGGERLLLCVAAWGGFALPQALLALGIERSTGTLGALLTPLEPIGIVVGSALFLGDRLTRARGIAVALGTLGALAVVGQGHIDPRLGDPLGAGLIALGHLAWAVYTVATKPLLARHDPMRVTLWIVVLSVLPVGGLALTEPFDAERARLGIFWVVLLAFLATAVGTWTWNYALRRVSASTLGTFVFLQPVVGLAAGTLFLDESVSAVALLGAAAITAGVVLETRSSGSSEPQPPPLPQTDGRPG